MSIIGKLIRTYRKEFDITQDALVGMLSAVSPDLKKLNTVTLSRWETGSTSPGSGKKKALLKFIVSHDRFRGTSVHALLRNRFMLLAETTSERLSGANSFLVGNHPHFGDSCHCIDLLESADAKALFLEHIVDIEKATHPPGFCRLSAQKMEQYLQYPSTFAVVCRHKRHYLGHFIMLKIKPETAEAIAYNQRSKYDISPDELCNTEETGSYIILAVYASNPEYAMRLKTEAYLFLLDNVGTVKDLVIFSTRTDGETMSRNYGITQVAQGEDKQYGFRWFGLLSPVEEILFSDTVIKHIF